MSKGVLAKFFGLYPSVVMGIMLSFSGAVTKADGLDSWKTTRHIDNDGASVAYGNGRFVVACPYKVLVSTNGADWETHLAPDLLTLAGLTFGNGQFLLSYNNINSLEGGFVLYSSTDGVNWRKVLNQPSTSGWIYFSSVVAGGGLFVVTSKELCVSTNLTNWDVSIPHVGGVINNLTYGGGLFMGNFLYGGVISSSDGFLWDYQSDLNGLNCLNVQYANVLFVGFCPGASDESYPPAVAISPDGYNWTTNSLPGLSVSSGIYAAGDSFFLFNDTNRVCYSSQNGLDWTRHQLGIPFQCASIAYGANTFVAVGSGLILQSAQITNAPTGVSPSVAIQTLPGLTINGTVGQRYLIEYTENLENQGSFQTLTNVCLPCSPYIWADTSAANRPKRFYRVSISQ